MNNIICSCNGQKQANCRIGTWTLVNCQIKYNIARKNITVLFHICLHTMFHHLLVLYLSDWWSFLVKFNNLVEKQLNEHYNYIQTRVDKLKLKKFWQHPSEVQVDWLTHHKQTVFLFYSKQHVKHSFYLRIYTILYDEIDRDHIVVRCST